MRRLAAAAWLALVVGFLLAFVAATWRELPEYEWRFAPGWLVVSGLAAGTFLHSVAAAWRGILAELGATLEPPVARAIFAKGLIARYVPTGALTLVTRVALAEREGVSKRVTVASSVYELACSVAATAALASYFVITLPAVAGHPARFAILAVVPLTLVALHPRVLPALADRILRALGREPLGVALPLRSVARFAALYAAVWVLGGLSLVAFARSLQPLGPADIPHLAAAPSLAFIVAVLTFVLPAGIGSRDVAIAAALAVSLPLAAGVAIAVGFRLFQTLVEVAWVLLVIPRTRSHGARTPRAPAPEERLDRPPTDARGHAVASR